jgi:hypothetical protein
MSAAAAFQARFVRALGLGPGLSNLCSRDTETQTPERS